MTQTMEKVSQRSASGIALSPIHLVFSLAIGAGWLVGTLVTSIFPAELASILSALLAIASLQILVGGIGYLVRLELELPQKLSFSDALSNVMGFIAKRWPSLLAAPWLMGAALLLVTGLVAGVTQILVRIPLLGGLISSLLIIPMFVFVLAMVAVGLNTYLLPCVVGIEGCNALAALRRLLYTVQENPIQLMGGYLKIVLGFLPMALGSLIVTGFGLSFTLLICKGGQAMDALSLLGGMGSLDPFGSGSSLNWSWLDNLSIGFIGFAWATYVVTSVTSSFAVLYYNASPGQFESQDQ
ncbi:MAG: hypothetical protein AAGD25_34140 [Cyanobacteria bacterium P01_F01_bin.150]